MKSLMAFVLITILVGVLSMSCGKETIREIAGPVEYDTTTVLDTITVVDTIEIVDTITISQCEPFVQFAFAALQYYGNAEILTFINNEFGIDDGWIYYLSITQCDLQSPSPGVYNIYGYANYWTIEFDAYYPLEYYWGVSYLGNDPSDIDNWELTDPSAQTSTLSANKTGGIKIATERMLKQ